MLRVMQLNSGGGEVVPCRYFVFLDVNFILHPWADGL